MENLTYAELVAILGEEAANAIMEQRKASEGSGKLPFKLLKPVAEAMGNELGAFGEFILGSVKNTEGEGYTDLGTNYGKNFQFILVSQGFYYKKFQEVGGKGKTLMSSMVKSLGELSTIVDNAGNPMPASKEARDTAGWRLIRVNAGLIRKDAKDTWTPCIWEIGGTLLFGFNELVGKSKYGAGALSSILNVVSTHKKNGVSVFVALDEAKSSAEALPTEELKVISEPVKDIINKMREYTASKTKGGTPQPQAQASTGEVDKGW